MCDLAQRAPPAWGLLTNRFVKRLGCCARATPPTSVAASGFMVGHYVSGEIYSRIPCARGGCWGSCCPCRLRFS